MMLTLPRILWKMNGKNLYQEKKIAQWYDSLYFKSHTHLILTVDALNSGEFLGFKPSNPCDRIDSPLKTPVLFSDMQICDWVS